MRIIMSIAGALLAIGFVSATSDAWQRFHIAKPHASSTPSLAANPPGAKVATLAPSTFAERFDAADPPTR